MTDLPECLNRAREEILLALCAESPEDERFHRKLADALTAAAVQDIEREPDRVHDWSLLAGVS